MTDTVSSLNALHPAAPPPTPKHHRGRTALIVLGLTIVALLFAIAWVGLIRVPLLSTLLKTDQPIDLGVHPTAADFASVQTKTPLQVEGDAGTFSVFGEKAYAGSVAVDNELTSAELTAWVQHYTATDPDIGETQVKFIDGGMEISTFAKRYVHTPIYVKVYVTRTGPQSVTLDVATAKVGRLRVPERYRQQFSEYAQRILNEHLTKIPGFSMTSLEYREGSRRFTGTYPASVRAASGQWW